MGDVWPDAVSDDDRSLWTAKLFPSFSSNPSQKSLPSSSSSSSLLSELTWFQYLKSSLPQYSSSSVCSLFQIQLVAEQWKQILPHETISSINYDTLHKKITNPPFCHSPSELSRRFSISDLLQRGSAREMFVWRLFLQVCINIQGNDNSNDNHNHNESEERDSGIFDLDLQRLASLFSQPSTLMSTQIPTSMSMTVLDIVHCRGV